MRCRLLTPRESATTAVREGLVQIHVRRRAERKGDDSFNVSVWSISDFASPQQLEPVWVTSV
jgi:hypothetical protein